MKKQGNKECMQLHVQFYPPGALIMGSTCPIYTFSKHIHYHYGAYMIWCRSIVHVNNHTCTKAESFLTIQILCQIVYKIMI